MKNLPANLNFSYADDSQRHNITITGGEEDLKNVTLTSLGASINLEGLGVGRHVVEVTFDLPENLKLKSKVRVEVLLTQSGNEQPEPTVSPTASEEE